MVPIYTNPACYTTSSSGHNPPHRAAEASNGLSRQEPTRSTTAISCASMRRLPALGKCASGVSAVYANANGDMLTDNPLEIDMPVVTSSNPAAQANTSGLAVGTLLVRANDSATLEKARTLLTLFNTTAPSANGGGLTLWQMGDLEPETFGEVAQIRNDDLTNVETVPSPSWA